MVYISSRKDLLDYCKSNNIRPEDFNEPVTLNPDFNNTFDIENSYEYLLYDDDEYEDYLGSVANELYSLPEKLSKEERLARYDLFVHGLFYGFTRFNSDLIISDGITNISGLLDDAVSFNREIIIPHSVKYASRLFRGCTSYNQFTVLPNSVIDIRYMFEGCKSYNQSFVIPEGVDNCAGLFCECSSYNQDTSIPDTVTNTYNMYYNCESFNSVTNIPLAELTVHQSSESSAPFSKCDTYIEPYWCMFKGCKSLSWDRVIIPVGYDTPESRDKIYKWCFEGYCGLKPIDSSLGPSFPEDAHSCKGLNEPIEMPVINPFESTSLF